MSEIFPDKLTPVERTVVGEAAALLSLLGQRSVSGVFPVNESSLF